MKGATIRRVPYERSIFVGLKHLIPIGVNVRQISESDHDAQLCRPLPTPERGGLEALHERAGLHATTAGEELFSVAALTPDAKRINLVFESPKTVSSNLIMTLQKLLSHDYEIYLASASFTFGVFIRTAEILVWEAE